MHSHEHFITQFYFILSHSSYKVYCEEASTKRLVAQIRKREEMANHQKKCLLQVFFTTVREAIIYFQVSVLRSLCHNVTVSNNSSMCISLRQRLVKSFACGITARKHL